MWGKKARGTKEEAVVGGEESLEAFRNEEHLLTKWQFILIKNKYKARKMSVPGTQELDDEENCDTSDWVFVQTIFILMA